jgi:hypothetical protein
MRTTARTLLAATALVVAGAGVGHAAGPTDVVRSPNEVNNHVAIIVGVGESRELAYVDGNSPAAPVTAFAGAPTRATRGRVISTTGGIPVVVGMGESAQTIYVPEREAPRTAFGGRG